LSRSLKEDITIRGVGVHASIRGGNLDLSVVIVSYNVRPYLAECLNSIEAACDGIGKEIFVVDNASIDRSAQWVAEHCPAVSLFANTENVGFARAVNQALRFTQGRYVLLLNPDTILPPKALTRLVQVADRWPDVGLLAPGIRDPLKRRLRGTLRPFPTWRTLFSDYTLAKPLLGLLPRPPWTPVVDQPTRTGWLVGSCLLIRRAVIEAIGGLDERYFIFEEDVDYCRRAVNAGWFLLYTREVEVFHYRHKSVEAAPPGPMEFHRLRGLLLGLERDHPVKRRALKALFKPLFLATAIARLVSVGLKSIAYQIANRPEKAAKYRRRFAATRDLAGRFLWRVLRL